MHSFVNGKEKGQKETFNTPTRKHIRTVKMLQEEGEHVQTGVSSGALNNSV